MANWDLINAMAEKRFGREAVAAEAALFVLEALRKEDWKILRAFSGKASFGTYLRSVVFRLLEDFSRRKYGRLQPPSWLRRLGGIWLLLYSYLCLERLTIAEAVEMSHQRFQARTKAEIERAAREIKRRITDCGSHQMIEVELDEGGLPDAEEGRRRRPEEMLERHQRLELLQAVWAAAMTPGDFEKSSPAGKVDFPFQLTSQEKLLIRMRYVDGLTVAKIAALLGCSRHRINGRLRRLLMRLRRVLEAGDAAAETKSEPVLK